jgi:VanZ family protein
MPGTSNLVRRAWVPALLWLAVIAWESSPFGSSDNSGRLLLAILSFFHPQLSAAQLDLLNGVLRKIGHCFGYAMLSLLMLRAWWCTLLAPRHAARLPRWRMMWQIWSGRAALLALVSTMAASGLDEWHQTLLPGRTGTIHDVFLDSMAAASVQLLLIAASSVRPEQLERCSS